MLSRIMEDANIVPKTIGYKLEKRLATLADEEEACTKPEWAYGFALYVPGADIERCQKVVCKDPGYAYCFANCISKADIEKCQESACKDPEYAYMFALYIPGADIEKCRKACKGTRYAF